MGLTYSPRLMEHLYSTFYLYREYFHIPWQLGNLNSLVTRGLFLKSSCICMSPLASTLLLPSTLLALPSMTSLRLNTSPTSFRLRGRRTELFTVTLPAFKVLIFTSAFKSVNFFRVLHSFSFSLPTSS